MLYQTKNPHGGDIYETPVKLDFSANTNPLGTPQGVVDAVHSSLADLHRYPDPYCRSLVAAISEFEEVPPQYILCGNGAADLIYAYAAALKPKKAVETAPTFSEYALGLSQWGCQVEPFLLHASRDFSIDETFLEFIGAEEPDVVFLCNPNNPTGRTVRYDLLERIIELCKQKNIFLFLDECFLDLTEGGVSAKGLLGTNPQLLILKAFTKSYGMAGIRLGYCLCADADLLGRMSSAVQPWNVSSLAQAAGVAALKEQAFLEKTRALVCQERQWMTQKLQNFGFWVCPSQTNFLLFRGTPGLHEALKEQGIVIRNCDNYRGLGSGWYRTAVRQHKENVQLMDAISQIAEREKPWQKIL